MKEESEKVCLKLNIQKTKIMAFGPITSWQINGETMETVTDFILGGAPKLLLMVTAAMKLKDKLRQHIRKQRHHYTNKGPYIQSYGVPSSLVQM